MAVNQTKMTATGFEYDRRWMLVDSNNRFISQREVSQLALLQVSIEKDGLRVTHRTNYSSFVVPFKSNVKRTETMVTIWDDTCSAEYVGDEADSWFTEILDFNCRLVYMPDTTKRLVDQRYAPGNSVTSFSDAYPVLIISQASLDDLNSRLAEKLQVNRFRPNIVFMGGAPYAEDLFAHFRIGEVNFYGVKLCARCVITTIDQENLAKGIEPLKTLADYRRKGHKILFGQNLVHKGNGLVSVGDCLEIISINHEERFTLNEPV